MKNVVRIALVTLALGASAPAWADSSLGDNTTITTRGTVQTQVALALGTMASAHNNAGGVTFGRDLKTGRNVAISTQGSAQTQVALALGTMATASNNVGGVLILGGR